MKCICMLMCLRHSCDSLVDEMQKKALERYKCVKVSHETPFLIE